MTGQEDNREDGDSERSPVKEDGNLFFMEPDHEEVRAREDPDTLGYWEVGLTTESLNQKEDKTSKESKS